MIVKYVQLYKLTFRYISVKIKKSILIQYLRELKSTFILQLSLEGCSLTLCLFRVIEVRSHKINH